MRLACIWYAWAENAAVTHGQRIKPDAGKQANAGEQQKLLEHYQEKSYFYGRQAQDRQSHTWALMIKYEQAAKASLSKAAFHRQAAAELRHRNAPVERLTHARARGPAALPTIGDARNGLVVEDR